VVALVAHVDDAKAAAGAERDRIARLPAVDAEQDRRRVGRSPIGVFEPKRVGHPEAIIPAPCQQRCQRDLAGTGSRSLVSALAVSSTVRFPALTKGDNDERLLPPLRGAT